MRLILRYNKLTSFASLCNVCSDSNKNKRNKRLRMSAKKFELINLQPPMYGFVVYGFGSGISKCVLRGQKLEETVALVQVKMHEFKDSLNSLWHELDKDNPDNPDNHRIAGKFLEAGNWALVYAMELSPFVDACRHGPTSPLRSHVINLLDELSTKGFAVAHMYGDFDTRLLALRGLLTDFHLNGGVMLEQGEVGTGFYYSFNIYYRAYFSDPVIRSHAYNRFGELVAEISKLRYTYPNIAQSIRDRIEAFIKEPKERGGFVSEHTSPEKTVMLAGFQNIIDSIDRESQPQKAA